MRSLWAFPGIRKLGWHCWPALKYGMHDSRLCADLSKDSIRVKHNHIHLHTIGPVSVYAPELKAEVLPQELSNRRQCIRLLPPLYDNYAGLAGPETETETARRVHCFNLVYAMCHHAAIAIIHAPVICSASHVPGHHHHKKASTSSHACGPEMRDETETATLPQQLSTTHAPSGYHTVTKFFCTSSSHTPEPDVPTPRDQTSRQPPEPMPLTAPMPFRGLHSLRW